MAAFDRVSAKSAGYTDQEIDDYLRAKQAALPAAPNPNLYLPATPPVATPSAPVAPVKQAPIVKPQPVAPVSAPEAAVKKSLLQGNLSADNLLSGNDLFSSIVNTVAKPFVKTGENIAGAGFEGARAINSAINPKDTTANAQDDPFINEADFSGSKGITDQLKNSAAIASYAVPFGKAGFAGSKYIVPGAVAGAAQSLPDAQSAEDVARGALTGAAVGGATQAVSKAASAVGGLIKGASAPLEKGATAIDEGTRQIRQKASVFGAGNEKSINQTLDKYGFKGSPQTQYEALKPTMDRIENQIKKVIKTNPDISVPKSDIIDSFKNNLKSALRSKDLTQTQATTEIKGYLNDLIKASGGKGQFTDISLERLRNLKKLVNADYGPVHDISERGGSLTPRQKVISAAWDSLDQAVKGASPEMKTLLKDESNLYKAAPSLSSARSNPPTFRFAGTSVPAAVTQKGKDIAAGAMRTGASVTGTPLPSMPSAQVAGQVARLPSIIQNAQTNSAQGQVPDANPEITFGNDNGAANNNIGDQGQNASGNNDAINNTQATTNYITGYAPEALYRGYLSAVEAGDKANAAQLSKMYTDETSYQTNQAKLNKTATAKPLSAQQVKDVALSNSGLRNLKTVKSELGLDKGTVNESKIISAVYVPGNPNARKLQGAVNEVVDAVLRLRTGAQANPSEIKLYTDQILKPGDSYGAIMQKLNTYEQYLSDIAGQKSDVPDVSVQTPDSGSGYLPAIQ